MPRHGIPIPQRIAAGWETVVAGKLAGMRRNPGRALPILMGGKRSQPEDVKLTITLFDRLNHLAGISQTWQGSANGLGRPII